MPSPPDAERLAALDAAHGLFAGIDRATLVAALEATAPEDAEGSAPAGLTVGLKANIAVAGTPWHAGLWSRASLIAENDAHVTACLRDAGAQVLPGLNMDAAALGGVTDNPDFGRTDNPHAPGFSSGGSSGGSAAAVACGLVDIALGTDTLGSIRIPASWCGVFGLKPTFGLVGRTDIVPLAPSLDVAGPIAAHAAQLWPVLCAIAGPDTGDPSSRPAPQGWRDQAPVADARGIRVGLPDSIAHVACEDTELAALDRAAEALRSAGADVRRIAMPGWRPETLRKAGFLLLECEAARVHAEALDAGDVLPACVQHYLSYGRDAPSGKLVAALEEIEAARAQLDRSFADVDVLLTPTTPQRAIAADMPAPANQADFTALANAAGVPALAVPVWLTGERLPASVQLTGPAWSEPMLIALGAVLEEGLA